MFPIGEAKDDSIKASNLRFSNPEHERWFAEKYKSILSLHEEISSVSGASLGETENKKAVGINTDSYDYKANSSGQDNVGQILFALLSFRKIAETIIKGSETYDLTGSDKYKVTITDDDGQEIDYRQFRVTWQKKSKDSEEKRFRIIPYKYNNEEEKKKTDTKLDIPVYYNIMSINLF